MAEEDCPCLHNDAAYRPGDSIRVDCNTWWVHALRGGAGGGRGGREQQLKDHMDRGPSGPWAGPLAGGREELRLALPLPGKAPRVPSLPGRCPRPGSAQQMAGLQVPGLQKLLPATPADGQGWVPILVPTVAVSRTYLCPLQHLPEPQVGVQQPALPGHLRGLRGRPLHHLRRRAVQLRGQLRVHAGPGMGSPRPSLRPAGCQDPGLTRLSLLSQDYCGGNGTNGTFRIVTENIPCGTTGVACSKAIKLFLEVRGGQGRAPSLCSRWLTLWGPQPWEPRPACCTVSWRCHTSGHGHLKPEVHLHTALRPGLRHPCVSGPRPSGGSGEGPAHPSLPLRTCGHTPPVSASGITWLLCGSYSSLTGTPPIQDTSRSCS